MKKRKPSKITLEKYRRVVDEWFLNGFKGAEAYRTFYPNVKNSTATVNFSAIIQIEEVKKYIKEKHEEARRVLKVDHEGVLAKLKRFAEIDLTETIGLTKDELKELPIDIKQFISGYKTKTKNFYGKNGKVVATEETLDLKFISKDKIIDMINKHIGFYEADNKQKIPQVNYDNVSTEALNEFIKNAGT